MEEAVSDENNSDSDGIPMEPWTGEIEINGRRAPNAPLHYP